jgi:pSer/pThr/pTyr-binding forkhead associated (FHA) protein
MYRLLQMAEDEIVREYRLHRDVYHVGRNPGNDLQTDDAGVSGSHARIRVVPSPNSLRRHDVTIEDLGTNSGTRVNGRRITRARLRHGDLLRLGALVLQFVDDQAAPAEQRRISVLEDQSC